MDYLQQLCGGARTSVVQYFVDRPYWIALTLLLAVFLHYLFMSTVWFRLLLFWPSQLARQVRQVTGFSATREHDVGALRHRWLGGILWKPLVTSTVQSPHRAYELMDKLSGGDLCDVYIALSQGGLYVLKITKVAAGNHLLLKEEEILGRLAAVSRNQLYRQYLPSCVDVFTVRDKQAVAFRKLVGGRDALSIMTRCRHGVSNAELTWIFHRLLTVLGYVHRQGWVHGGVLPPHLLLCTGYRHLQLLGWIHAERLGGTLQLVPTRYKAWYPPECHARQAATPATDIYLAAKCMQWLSGGTPSNALIAEHLPRGLRLGLQQCLSDDLLQRPQDAWTLRDEIEALLE